MRKGNGQRASTWLVGGLLGATALVAPSGAQAQATTGELEEVVVTAQKRSENLQEVPVAVTALTESRIAASGVTNTLDLNAAVPALNTVTSLGFAKPFLRGIGSTANGAGIEPPVAIYVDGVYYASAPAALFSLNNTQRIEVLKGPQGTLFGRNATGGLIHVITKDPTDAPELRLRAGYGAYESYELGAYAAGPLGEKVKGGLAVQYADMGEGYGTNVFNGSDANKLLVDWSARGKLIVDLAPQTVLKLNADYYHRSSTFFGYRPPREYPTNFITTLPSRVWDVNLDNPVASDAEGSGASARLEHDFGAVTFTSTTAYRRNKLHYQIDTDGTSTPASAVNSFLKDHTFTEELQLQSSGSSRLKWTAGVFYIEGASGLYPQIVGFGGPLAAVPARYQVVRLPIESISAYAQATYALTEQTSLTIGGRYTEETRKVDSSIRRVSLSTGVIGADINPPRKAKVEADKFTWRLALDHRFTDDVMVYASVNTGFRSGGFSAGTPNEPAYAPETITAYEIGLKSEFADNRIRLNAAAFHYDYKDMQVSRSLGGVISIYNGAKARVNGVDADLDWIVSKNLSVYAGVAVLDTKFTSFPFGIRAAPNLVTGRGFVTSINQDLSGNELPMSADFTSTVGFDLHVETEQGTWGAAGNWNHNDGFFTQEDNLLRQKAYDLVSLTGRWESPDGRYRLTVWGRNLLNEDIVTQKIAGTNNGLETFQPPRTYGVTAEVNF